MKDPKEKALEIVEKFMFAYIYFTNGADGAKINAKTCAIIYVRGLIKELETHEYRMNGMLLVESVHEKILELKRVLKELKKNFTREFVMTSEEYDEHVINFDGTTEEFYMYCLKTFERSGKKIERRGRPPKNPSVS